jgi:hypothetical protein
MSELTRTFIDAYLKNDLESRREWAKRVS